MKLSSSSAASLHEVLHKIVQIYTSEEDQLVSTDFYFQPSHTDGKLSVFNDNDEEIANTTIAEWAQYTPEAFYSEVEADLSTAIAEANTEGNLERLAVWMPYSLVLVDEERETIADLLLVDDDALLVTKGLMAGLDEELNKFIEELLSE